MYKYNPSPNKLISFCYTQHPITWVEGFFLSLSRNQEPNQHIKMGKILFGIIAAVASFMLVESLTCNQCKYGLLGFCLSNNQVTCSTNTSVCFTGKTTFTSLTSVGFNTQGCQEPAGCNTTTNGTLLNVPYTITVNCCSSNNCNPVQVSGAPSTKMTLTAAVGVAALASMWGSIL
ncbi:hypothetical protein EPR50_G00147200 [Perca flavescens]|uniref:UPAR/Ly6 domain-containing protein n=1 Tax=Perca flavescens TaxID=8167 RepID=A0A484CPQ5_PERFV|nr:hypothetical protein EPR50_G00147200 [Perca flavescens]